MGIFTVDTDLNNNMNQSFLYQMWEINKMCWLQFHSYSFFTVLVSRHLNPIENSLEGDSSLD